MARPKHDEGEVCLIGEMTPICNWEGFWKPRDAREEVILPCTNFPFCQIGVVYVGWGVLEVCILFFTNEGFDVMRRLVIHLVKLQFEAPCCEVDIHQWVCPQELLLRPAFDGDKFDKISIINVEHDDVLVASIGSDGEPAQLVTEQHARDLSNGHEDKVRMCVEGFLGERCSIVTISLPWGGNGGGTPAGEEVLVNHSP